jgi:hypothetical protein
MDDDLLSELLNNAQPIRGPDHLVFHGESPLFASSLRLAYERVGNLLLDTRRLTGTGVAFVVCLPDGGCFPPYRPEWAVLVSRTGPTVSLAAAEDPILLQGNTEPRILRAKADLDTETFQAVEAAWETMLRRVQPPNRQRSGGDLYVFGRIQRGEPTLTGESWRAADEAPAGRLVRLGHTLRDYALGNDDSQPRIAEQICAQADWFRNAVLHRSGPV